MTTIILAALLGFAGGCLFGWFWSNKTVKLALKISREFAKSNEEELPTADIITTDDEEPEEAPVDVQPITNPGALLIDYKDDKSC